MQYGELRYKMIMENQHLINNTINQLVPDPESYPEGGSPGIVSAGMARNTATVPKSPLPDRTVNLLPLDQPIMRLHLWLETEKGVFFGLGRQRLLECIRSGLSLKAAADHLGMSYRAAWGKIKQTEKVLGITLIEKKGGNRSGYKLTPAGEMLTTRFEQWYAEVEQFALARSRTLMSSHTLSFEDAGAHHTEKSLPKT
jgi:molybdate transport system regulatory protein